MNNSSSKVKEGIRRKDAELDMRRKACVAAAEELFASKGFEETSMQEIAQAVGISVGSLYNMFQSKAELFHQVFLHLTQAEEEWIQTIITSKTLSVYDALTSFIEGMINSFREHQALFRAIVLSFSIPFVEHKDILEDMMKHREKMLGCLADIVARGIKGGLIREDVIPGRVAAALAGSMMGLFAYMVQYEDGVSASLTAREICDSILSGIGRRAQDA